MYLSNVYDALQHGELSQLALAAEGDEDGICEEKRKGLSTHIQLGLTALYTRFNLKEATLLLEIEKDRNDYVLEEGSLLKVTQVHDNMRNPVTLNKVNDPCSVRTPSDKTLYVPDMVIQPDPMQPPLMFLSLTYRANHPTLNRRNVVHAPHREPIELPQTHLQALLFFVASRMMNPIGMTEEFHAGNTYYAKYDAECRMLEGTNHQIDIIGEETKFQDRGFV